MTYPPPIAILGVPIHNLTQEQMVRECLFIASNEGKSRHSQYACPINFKLLSEVHGWNYTHIRHPEILKISRESRVGIANSRSIRWLSQMLGSPLQESIKIKDLFIRLAEELGNKQLGLFLLGGEEKKAKALAVRLHNLSPGIKIVGIATPPIYTQGEDLIYAPERMALLSEQINEANSDVLAINLGSPKQEIWHGRIKRLLHVPLAIGVGDAFTEIEEDSPSSNEVSWSTRLFTFFKGIYMSLPLVFYHNINRLVYKFFHAKKGPILTIKNLLLFLSPYRSLVAISLPPLIDKSNVESLAQIIEEGMIQDVLILDFKDVHHIQPEGFYLLIKIWQKLFRENREFYGIRVNSDVLQLMRVHRVWDLLKGRMCKTPEALMVRIAQKGTPQSLYDAIQQKGNQVVVTFFGALDNSIDYGKYLERFMPTFAKKDCVLNLSLCTSIENTGFIFLLKLRKMLSQQGNRLRLCDLNKTVKRQLKLAKLEDQFEIYSTLDDIPL